MNAFKLQYKANCGKDFAPTPAPTGNTTNGTNTTGDSASSVGAVIAATVVTAAALI